MKQVHLLLFAVLFSFGLQAASVKVSVKKAIIPTYTEPEREDLPMFAENRVHQRTSGNPYPNKIVLKVNHKQKVNKEYTLITLENEYLQIEILPELGGKIYSAKDKTNGYDFFYKNNVVKPSLIGALGSWTSGGLEFNWPYHHRASSFMPVDYEVEKLPNGGAIVWMSEHDPVDRMKGTFGIVLNPGESIFETRVKLSNRTPFRHSFLWWENVAVPSNKNYEIFFPHDVSHVFFHYKRSVTTYPIASNAAGIFNGIRYDGTVDISKHKNTVQPTSYFSAASKYDFFGGYDNGKKCGVVHVGDHHVSPGKKMFTWAYNQLSDSWEKALTDTDGPYCELMAGSYSDNQPDFSWLEPTETKIFSQFWFPIGEMGVPDFANKAGAISCKNKISVQMNKANTVRISVANDKDEILFSEKIQMNARKEYFIPADLVMQPGYTVKVSSQDGNDLMKYQIKKYDNFNIPQTTQDMPNLKKVESALQLYLEGLHVDQYRDPVVKGASYYKEAILRDPNFTPALIALGEQELKNAFYNEALEYLYRAEKVLTQFNTRLEDGKLYYLLGQTYLALNNTALAYDYFQKSAWASEYVSPAMTYISLLDVRNKEYEKALEHLNKAVAYNQNNTIANAMMIYVSYLNGNRKMSDDKLKDVLSNDKLNHLAGFFGVLTGKVAQSDFMGKITTDKNQLVLDLAETLLLSGLKDETIFLVEMLKKNEPICFSLSAIYADLKGTVPDNSASEGIAFPNRRCEIESLQGWSQRNNAKAKFQLACALYDKGHYSDAAGLWSEVSDNDYRAARNLAVAYYTHLGRKNEVLPLLKKALSLSPENEQLVFETAYVMGRTGVSPIERLSFLDSQRKNITRDDVVLEWARAYNMAGKEDEAIKLLEGRDFVPCEGGEHAVAEQYMMAYYLKGRRYMAENKLQKAIDCFRKAQTLPQNLGAGLWNYVKLVPYKYYEGLCLKSLGQIEKANENFKYITAFEIDYFSDMHLRELPYYQALSWREMGQGYKGDMLINNKLREWQGAINTHDAGYFSATPFFLSYCDDAKQSRTAYYSYLMALAYDYTQNIEMRDKYFYQAKTNDPYALNIFAEEMHKKNF